MPDERRLPLSDTDIERLADAINGHVNKCRFTNVTIEDLQETVNFVKHFNQAMDEGKSVVRKTLLVALVWAILGLIGVGAGYGFVESFRRYWNGS